MHGVRHHHSYGRFWFDLSEIPELTSVISAELRLYINSTVANDNTEILEKDPENLWKAEEDEKFSISLYEIGVEDSLVFIDQMEVDNHQEGWVAFNVTLPLRHWLEKPEENFGLQLVCRLSVTGNY